MVNKLERYLDNISDSAKNQCVRFLLEHNDKQIVLNSIEEFNKMYPGDNNDNYE